MSIAAPPFDPRTAADLRDELAAKLAANVSGWAPDGDQASAALIGILSRFGELVIERLNQAPDKNFLAFLDLLGTTPLPPTPARVPLTFSVVAGSATDAVVPAGTQVAAPPGETETTPTVFETERELTAIAATLEALVAVDAERDFIADRGSLLAGPVPSGVRAFAGDRANEHVLYAAFSALLANATIELFTVSLEMAAGSPAASDARSVQWEIWDGMNGIPLTPSTDTTRNLSVSGAVSFANPARAPEQSVNGVPGRWIRCRLLTPVSPGAAPAQGMVRASQLPLVADVRCSVVLERKGLTADAAFSNGESVDVTRAFLPFGDKPKIGDAFYLGSREAFGQPGGAITIDVALVNSASDGGASGVPSSDLQLRWEVWDGSRWALLGVTTPKGASGGGSLLDDDKAFTESGSVEFTLPDSLAPTRVNGVESNWVRVQIVSGNYGVEAAYVPDPEHVGQFKFVPATFAPPLVAALTLSYSVITAPAAPDAVVAFNNRQFEDLQSDLAAGRAAPFAGFPSRPPALYAAFTLPPSRTEFPNRPVSLYHGVRLPPYGEKVVPLAPELSIQTASAGNTVVHRYGLTNSTADLVDCDLAVVGGAWASTVDAPHVRLPPGSSREVQVSVTVPGDERLPARGAADRGFLTVRFSSDAAVHSAAFETRAGDVAPPRRDLSFEYWNGRDWARLPASDGTELLRRPGVIEFLGPADFAPSRQFGVTGYWIRALLEPGGEPPVQLRALLPNTTFATNTVTLNDDVLGSSDASANQIFHTRRSPVLAGPRLEVREPGSPSREELALLGAAGEGAVTPAAGSTSEVWVRWMEVVDFHGSGPRDRHYVLDHIAGEVRFGDGVRGRIPPRGIGNVRMARYQTGGGASGNRAAGTIVELHDTVPYVDRVTNLEPADGGIAAESTASLVTRGPRALRHGGRAVALEDYEDLARMASPAVARAKTVPVRQLRDDPLGNTPAAGAVSVIIVPQSADAKPLPSVGLMAQVEDRLRAAATPTASVAVVGPLYVRVDVSAELALSSIDDARKVEDAVHATLRAFLHPLTGGRQGAGWDFGRRPFLSDLYAVLSEVSGVDHVRRLSVDQVEDVAGALDTGRFLVYSGQHQISLTFVGAE
jgi:hypothetical protein